MRNRRANRERGAALLMLLAVIALGASWYLVSRLNTESGVAVAARKARNAEILNRAKLALIGYVAAQAVKAGENRPGALPCPEAPADFNDSANEGTVSYPCTLPKVGRLPWRTLGLEKLVDASGEPLWYVVSPGWAGANTVINSDSRGQLTVDGVANDSVALIIAPGPAFSAPAAAGCTAWNQVRPTTAPPDWRNYLECENATSPADLTFVTSKPPIVDSATKVVTPVSNDQVVRITAAEIMPAIEAAIANRIEREIVPVLKAVYADASWGTSASNPAFPFPAPFGNPGTSNYLGQAGLYQGLLPFNYHSSSCPVGDARCSTNALTWGAPSLSASGGPGYLPSAPSCYTSGTTPICEGYYYGGALNITLADPVNGITTGLRTFSGSNSTGMYRSWRWNGTAWVYLGELPTTGSRSLATTGAANFNSSATLPSVPDWGYYYIYATSRPTSANFADHSILDSADANTGWFARNEWYRLLYYAIAPGHAPGGSLSCTTGSNCLSVSNLTPANAQRSILVLAGRSVNGLARPSSMRADYFEFGNAVGSYERQSVTPAPASMHVDTGTVPNAYVVTSTSPVAGTAFQFRSANANTGASTLSTPATGIKSLVNPDGSNLAASTILANAAVQVTYDGSKFVLSKRPFNDRIVVVGSN